LRAGRLELGRARRDRGPARRALAQAAGRRAARLADTAMNRGWEKEARAGRRIRPPSPHFHRLAPRRYDAAPRGVAANAAFGPGVCLLDQEREQDLSVTSELIRRGRGGDRSAIDELLRRYRPRLVSFVHLRVPLSARSVADTQDVVQEVCERA